jgi:phospholipid/cholesterol/gamma-HCH transport system substrate-binding protein
MNEGFRNFMIGITSIIALVGLAGLLMSFGELDPIFNPRYEVTIKTDNAGGLRPGGSIEHNGVPIGVVHSVYTQPDPKYPVRIICRIRNDARIPADAKPFAATQLIGGSAILQLQAPPEGAAAAGNFLPADGSAEIVSPMRGGLLAEVTEELDARMRPLLDSLERFNRLSDTYANLGDSLNELVRPQDASALGAGEPPNLRTAAAKLNRVLDEAHESLSLAKSFLADEQMRANVRESIEKARALIEQATGAVDRYSKLADSLQHNADDITRHLLPVTDSLAATLEDVRRLTKLASEGKGTLGQLIHNPDLYNSLNDAATRLQQTLIQAQTLIEKLRAEGVMIKF